MNIMTLQARFGCSHGRILATALTATLMSGCDGVDPPHETSGVTVLKVADTYPTGHPFSKSGIAVFIEEVERNAKGSIRFEYFPAGQMGKAQDLPSLTRAGVLDIASIAPAYVPDQLPLASVADLPGLIEDSCSGSLALLQGSLQPGELLFETEFRPRGLRPLLVGIIPGYEVMTVKKQVKQPEDIRGMALRSAGGAMDRAVEAMGAATVSMPVAETYEALIRSVVDGTVLGPASATPYKLDEPINYSTLGARLGSFTMTYTMNEASFQKLSAEQQAVVLDAGLTATHSLCQALEEANRQALLTMARGGVKLHTIKEKERQQWDKATQPIQQQWVADMQAIRRPGERVLANFKQTLEKQP